MDLQELEKAQLQKQIEELHNAIEENSSRVDGACKQNVNALKEQMWKIITEKQVTKSDI